MHDSSYPQHFMGSTDKTEMVYGKQTPTESTKSTKIGGQIHQNIRCVIDCLLNKMGSYRHQKNFFHMHDFGVPLPCLHGSLAFRRILQYCFGRTIGLTQKGLGMHWPCQKIEPNGSRLSTFEFSLSQNAGDRQQSDCWPVLSPLIWGYLLWPQGRLPVWFRRH